jgi:5'-nucleotidase
MEDGSALDPAKTYTLTTLDFLAAGGDGYAMLTDAASAGQYGDAAEILADYIASTPSIRSEADGRLSPTGTVQAAA